jgi:acyl transferase domain-containing protein
VKETENENAYTVNTRTVIGIEEHDERRRAVEEDI